MNTDDLLGTLGYDKSPNFIQGEDLSRATDHAHIFRRAQNRMRLRGVYVLQQQAAKGVQRTTVIPVAYVCDADTEEQARDFRRLTWNQNAAPFLIIKTPACVRLFSTFNYIPHGATNARAKNVLDKRIELQDIATALRAFASDSIDDGTIWSEYGNYVTPKARVDWTLLDNLEKLDAALIASGLDWRTSHALIGKYVYLWYLHQRKILSPRRFSEWKIDPDDVFGRNATLPAFWSTLDRLDNWLNGSVFPLEPARRKDLRQDHLRKIAGVFCGDDPLDGQLHLPFNAFDFSVIPVETLSAIYEQFLHAHEPDKEKSRGKELGAYYTPIHLVNFMLDELNDHRPLKEGMTCFDPSCGSGAFLVQCFRRLIEARICKDGNPIRRPAELRDELLLPHIFGVDRDGDACRVTELSLILTLLDYVDPPDLSPVHNFKLPTLHNQNIFEADYFNPESTWARSAHDNRYAWVVGNPPWVELKPPKADEEGTDKDTNRYARKWVTDNDEKMPISGNQLAEAFLWKVTEQLQEDGAAAMLVPAMTLFKSESKIFRQRFFSTLEPWCIANFANLAEVLFAGRSRVPAAAFFYARQQSNGRNERNERAILTYAPLVANQQSNLPDHPRSQKDTWSLTINGSELREITIEEASSGDPLVWKSAMWGSRLDLRLLASLSGRFSSLNDVCTLLKIHMHQGVELPERVNDENAETRNVDDPLEFVPDLVGQKIVDFNKLRNCGRIYHLPETALSLIPKERAYWRVRGGPKGIDVCRAPHIIVDSARRFAVFSNEFIAIRHWHVGIAGKPQQTNLLKALALFLASDFAIYHQFLCSPKWGIHASIAGLDTLKALPFPVDNVERQGLQKWAKLHDAIVKADIAASKSPPASQPNLYQVDGDSDELSRLEGELDEMVVESLALRESERWLIADLVHDRLELIQGKLGSIATDAPLPPQMHIYCKVLKAELDSFIEVATTERYTIEVIHDPNSAMIAIRRAPARLPSEAIRILPANSKDAQALTRIRQSLLGKHSQWLYFERALRCDLNGIIYLFKSMQRLHWLRSQALIDAGEIIADAASGGSA